jgi:glycine/D-amino acid oxidase-like deaminating enzyme
MSPSTLRLHPVHVSADRIIRTSVGLRPFRPSGFVVRGEKLDSKTVIHNYGHGGSGITLSWGTAHLAVEEASKLETRECAVLGCGVIGLSTARLLQLRGYTVTIYTRDMPPETTSNVAGGLWEPVSLYDAECITPQFKSQFVEAAQWAFRRFQPMAGDDYGIRWLPLYTLGETAASAGPQGADSPGTEVEFLYPELKQLSPSENPFSTPFASLRDTMLIEPSIYLESLIRDFQVAGGKIQIRDFASQRDSMSLHETLVFNCTGLGARKLFQDKELIPIRGQLVFLLPQPEVGYMTNGPGNIYMFPRHDGVLLGGSFERGKSNLEPDPMITERILREHSALFSSMKQ